MRSQREPPAVLRSFPPLFQASAVSCIDFLTIIVAGYEERDLKKMIRKHKSTNVCTHKGLGFKVQPKCCHRPA